MASEQFMILLDLWMTFLGLLIYLVDKFLIDLHVSSLIWQNRIKYPAKHKITSFLILFYLTKWYLNKKEKYTTWCSQTESVLTLQTVQTIPLYSGQNDDWHKGHFSCGFPLNSEK